MRTAIKLKNEIIAKFENGVGVSDLAAQYNMAKSTISTFLKNKEAIKAAAVVKGVTFVHNKQRPQLMYEVDKLLLILLKEKELDGDSNSEGIICEKALLIYVDDLSSDEDEVRESVPSSLIKEMYAKWGEVQLFVEKYHPDTMLANMAVQMFNDNAMMLFRKILQRRQKQLALDKYLAKKA